MAFNSYRKTVLCIYFRSIFIFFFFLSPSRVEVKQNIRFPFLPGSPVYLRIQSTNMKPVTQIEQASAHVVVLSLSIQSPVALPQGDLPGFIYQQRADLLPPGTPDTPSGHTGTDIERTPAAARPAQRIFRPHRRPENTVLHFVIVVVFIGKAHFPPPAPAGKAAPRSSTVRLRKRARPCRSGQKVRWAGEYPAGVPGR